jgi:uncharacterized membrane protein
MEAAAAAPIGQRRRISPSLDHPFSGGMGDGFAHLRRPRKEDVMEARAKLFGHSIHQMLIVFPLGVLGMSFFFDLIALGSGIAALYRAAYYMIAAGIVSGLIAAVFGLIDFLGIPANTRAKRIGLLHGVGNVVVVALFAASWYLRRETPDTPATLAIALSAAGVALALVTGWMGGELIARLGVGVDDGANVNSPSSLSGIPATGGR